MKFVKLLHNPSAGDGDSSADELAALIESAGFKCHHESTKEITDNDINTDVIDIVALAGGDGTIRKVAKQLMDEKVPIGLFPKGTANNIATTLGISDDPQKVVAAWKKNRVKAFDIGLVSGLGEETFFLESIGYGVFPLLMDAMQGKDKKLADDPKARIATALELLREIVSMAAAVDCDITVDGKDYSGKFLLAEVMNTQSIGPNLHLSPAGDPGDGKFEIVLIAEKQRDQFMRYLSSKVEGREKPGFFTVLAGSEIEMFWHGTSLHVDDERKLLEKPCQVSIRLEPKAFSFLVA